MVAVARLAGKLDHSAAPEESYRGKFRSRLVDPEIGDMVEVAWKGKFRLESTDVYQGLAWWVAHIVDKHTSQSKYKIRYPGWESRWDEWVSRDRFRWLKERDVLVPICEGDRVELWCCGSNVPGAWLETHVIKVADDQYCLDKVTTAGPIWVSRNRLRLCCHSKNNRNDHTDPSKASIDPTATTRALSTVTTTAVATVHGSNRRDTSGSCSIM